MPLYLRTNPSAASTARILGENYVHLSDSVRRLSSGLRINSAADDAAGLAIRELMRADIAAYHQGIRNANDAISLIQTADGALAIIDEKLIRMKELAEQAATGTYNSTQRLIIDSEFQAMGAEIDRIARATDFNGIKLLDGSLSGPHDGSGLTSTGAMKIHFGAGNDSTEDYYYIDIGDCTCAGLGLTDGTTGAGTGNAVGNTGGALGTGGTNYGGVPILSDVVTAGNTKTDIPSGIVSFGIIPSGTTNLSILINDRSQNDDIQIFTRSGIHLSGTLSQSWAGGNFITESNGFIQGASLLERDINGSGSNINFQGQSLLQYFNYNGMQIGYTGSDSKLISRDYQERLTIDVVNEDLILMVTGLGVFDITADWTTMGTGGTGTGSTTPGTPGTSTTTGGDLISIKTQELAQNALERIDDAIVTKDNVRAHLGALQNRFENTVTNLAIQAENLQVAESRISDMDAATEMTEFVRNQILTQSAIAMLAQANSLPQMLVSLIEG